MKKAFEKFGKALTCPETEKSLYIPKDLKVKHKYQTIFDMPKVEDVLNES